MANQSTEQPVMFGLGRIYGYEPSNQSILPFQKNISKNIHKAVGLCFNQYAIMFNQTTSLIIMSKVYGEDLTQLRMSPNMKKNFFLIINMGCLDAPVSKNILAAAHEAAMSKYDGELIQRMKRGKESDPGYNDETGPMVLDHKYVELLSVEIGHQSQFYLCARFFNPEWAANNKITAWLAFEINTPADSDKQSQLLKIFGSVKPPRPRKHIPDKLESRIIIKSHRLNGKIILRRSLLPRGPKYLLSPALETCAKSL